MWTKKSWKHFLSSSGRNIFLSRWLEESPWILKTGYNNCKCFKRLSGMKWTVEASRPKNVQERDRWCEMGAMENVAQLLSVSLSALCDITLTVWFKSLEYFTVYMEQVFCWCWLFIDSFVNPKENRMFCLFTSAFCLIVSCKSVYKCMTQ